MIARFRRLGRERRRLLIDAAATLVLASLEVAFMPFRRAIRFGSVPLGQRDAAVSAQDCVWAVEAAARRVPWRTVCFQQGLSVQHMLRRRGFDARLHYGARTSDVPARLEAHVWVAVDGQAVMGGNQSADFAEVASYP